MFLNRFLPPGPQQAPWVASTNGVLGNPGCPSLLQHQQTEVLQYPQAKIGTDGLY